MPISRNTVAAFASGAVLTARGFAQQPAAPAPGQAAAAPAVDPSGQVIKSEKQTFKIHVIARNIETPWAIAFLPDGRLLITERPGRLRIVEKGKLLPDA